ncbi:MULTISPECIES: ParM/StbA family protein [Ramlibacter]|uniref:Actin-like protein N-terminal domain-containing protein n=1 Tax=Ramlibacter aquaticus TaxID=2780094 RepID=A0ABR9SCV8_9BURK|nr:MULTISPECIES: ParM/StbA family protein [Ramlibacter]MBE7940130.1 hypothetical protein [Ramlibacter aquaticus]
MKSEPHTTIPVAAIDVGYFGTKYATRPAPDKPVHCGVFPSLAPVLSSGEVDHIATKERVNGFVVPIDGLAYFVGVDAKALSNAFESRPVERNYARTARHLALARGAMIYIAETVRAVGNFRLNQLVVGLPLTTYRTHRDELAARLKGVHEIPNYRGNGTITVTVENVIVLMQPAGALLHFAEKEGGKLAGPSLVCDVGGGTLDYLVTQDGFKPNTNRSSANEISILAYCNAVAEALNPAWTMQADLIDRIDHAIRQRAPFDVLGTTYTPATYWPFVQRKVEESLSQMESKIGYLDSFTRILMTGGGAGVFAEVLMAKHPHVKKIVKVETDPVFSNVKGFCWAGERYAASASRAVQPA